MALLLELVMLVIEPGFFCGTVKKGENLGKNLSLPSFFFSPGLVEWSFRWIYDIQTEEIMSRKKNILTM